LENPWIEKFKGLKFNPFSSNMIVLPDFPLSFRNVLQKSYPRGDYRSRKVLWRHRSNKEIECEEFSHLTCRRQNCEINVNKYVLFISNLKKSLIVFGW